jgi:carboxypeptidase family protein
MSVRFALRRRIILAALLCGLGPLDPIIAQPRGNTGTIRVRAIAADTRFPLSGADVQLAGRGRGSRTDGEGLATFGGLAQGEYLVVARIPGFRADSDRFELRAGETVEVNFALRATPVAGDQPAEANPQPASRIIRGVVRDTAGLPVPRVTVFVDTVATLATDDSGTFRAEVSSANSVTLNFRRLGFRSKKLIVHAPLDTLLTVVLVPVVQPLPSKTVETERSRALDLHGFYERMDDREKGLNHGYFITREEIERRNPLRTTQVFEQINGVVVKRVAASCRAVFRCWAVLGLSGCLMTAYLDGQRLNSLDASRPGYKDDFLDELVVPRDIAGIEVYERGAEAPPHYQLLNGSCGVILIWTK